MFLNIYVLCMWFRRLLAYVFQAWRRHLEATFFLRIDIIVSIYFDATSSIS